MLKPSSEARLESLEQELTLIAVERQISRQAYVVRFVNASDLPAFAKAVATKVRRVGVDHYVGPGDMPLSSFISTEFEEFNHRLQRERRAW